MRWIEVIQQTSNIRGQILPRSVIIRRVATCTWWFFWSLNTLNIPTGVQSVWFNLFLVDGREQFGHARAVWGIVMRRFKWIHSTSQQTFNFEALSFLFLILFHCKSLLCGLWELLHWNDQTLSQDGLCICKQLKCQVFYGFLWKKKTPKILILFL